MALKMRGLTNARPQPTTKDERLCIASPPPPAFSRQSVLFILIDKNPLGLLRRVIDKISWST